MFGISVGLILVFNFIFIRGDYIAEDPVLAIGDDIFILRENESVVFDIYPTSTEIHSIYLRINNTKSKVYGNLNINVYEGEQNVGKETLNIDQAIKEDYSEYKEIEIIFQDSISVSLDKDYHVEISNGADNNLNAIEIRKTDDGKIWHCLTYTWIKQKIFFIASVVSELLLSLLLIILLFNIENIQPENVFLLISIPICLLFILFMPVFRVPDEIQHYLRTYSIIKGYLVIPSNGMISASDNLVASWLKAPYRGYFSPYITVTHFDYILSKNYVDYNIVGTALYNPVSYCFTTAGLWAAGLFSNNLYILFWCGRFANTIGSTLLIYVAIKIIPYGKGILALISLLPMNLQERASFSADAITYAAVVLFIAYILYLRSNAVEMARKHMVIIYSLLVLISACKIVYVVFAGLILLIPNSNYTSKSKAWIHKISGLVITAAIALGWLKIASSYLYMTNGGSNSSEKVIYLLSHPVKYCEVICNTTLQHGVTWIKELIAYPLGCLEISINTRLFLLIIITLLLYFVMTFVMSRFKDFQWDFCASTFLLLCSFAIIILIYTSLYVQWTKGDPEEIRVISGIQGRYFLPVLPAAMLAFITGKPGILHKEPVTAYKSANVLMFVYDLLVLLQVFMYFSAN